MCFVGVYVLLFNNLGWRRLCYGLEGIIIKGKVFFFIIFIYLGEERYVFVSDLGFF